MYVEQSSRLLSLCSVSRDTDTIEDTQTSKRCFIVEIGHTIRDARVLHHLLSREEGKVGQVIPAEFPDTRTTSPRLGEGGYVPQGQSKTLASTTSLFCSDPVCAGWYHCFYQSNAELFPEASQRHPGITSSVPWVSPSSVKLSREMSHHEAM